jgi:LmbE family N-acetylglucosaminyl deacetylase
MQGQESAGKGARGVAFAIAAHPDDIELMMAGTLILLKQAGYELHYLNIGNGSCGTATLSREQIIRIRGREARSAAKLIGAAFHPSLVDDLAIYYEPKLLAKLVTIIRRVRPTVMLVPALEDYMEDHKNSGRLAVTAAFCRGMRNFPAVPRSAPMAGEVTVYHALPYGLRDEMGRRVAAECYVDITSVLAQKREMLAQHRSQKEWLDVSQGVDAYLTTMENMCAEAGRMSGRFSYAEGWRRHNHLGFCAEEADPLGEALAGLVARDAAYRR